VSSVERRTRSVGRRRTGNVRAAAPLYLAPLLLATVGLGACSWTQGRPEAGPEGARQATALPSAAAAPSAAEVTRRADDPGAPTPVEIADSLLIRIENVQGASAAVAGVIFAPVQEPVEKCTPPRPGVLQVRVASHGGRAAVHLVPGSTVDPTTRQCVMDALAAIDIGSALPPSGQPSADARDFASTVDISW
jgi:hypothetical protein